MNRPMPNFKLTLIVTPRSASHPRFGQAGKVVRDFPETPNIKAHVHIEMDGGETLLDEPTEEWMPF